MRKYERLQRRAAKAAARVTNENDEILPHSPQ